MEILIHDLRLAIRGLRRASGFTVLAALTLALGIGANATMFSVLDAVLFRPLPYSNADRLVTLWTDDLRGAVHREQSPLPTAIAWKSASHTIQGLAYYNVHRETLNEKGVRERLRVVGASTNLFAVLGVSPVLGRALAGTDTLGERSAVVSDAFWHRRFNGDSRVVGQTFHVEAADGSTVEYRVAGVAPPAFYFPDKGVDFWTTAVVPDAELIAPFDKAARRWEVVARMTSAASVADVRRDLEVVGTRLAATHTALPHGFPGFSPTVESLRDSLTGDRVESRLWVLFAAVTLVLAIACANVAGLTLARGARREHEFAVRLALGATRARLAVQLVAESLVLSAIGGGFGLILAVYLGESLRSAAAGAVPGISDLAFDARVFVFVAGVSAVCGVIVGLAPIWHAAWPASGIALGDRGTVSGTQRALHARAVLVTGQCALAVVLLTGAGLFLRSLDRLIGVDPGFDPQRVVDVRIELPASGVLPDLERTERVLSSIGGVEATGMIDDMFTGSAPIRSISIAGRDSVTGQLNDARVTAGFFETMHVPLVRGRYLNSSDSRLAAIGGTVRAARPEPAVVNATFAQRFLADANALGQVFTSQSTHESRSYEIVGVVGDMHRGGRASPPIPEFYTAYAPTPRGRLDLLVRVKQGVDPARIAPVIQASARQLVSGSLIWYVTTVSDQFDQFDSGRRFETWLLTGFAALALVLAVVGIYGVVQYAVTQRTREIGLRMALGANQTSVMRVTLWEGLRAPLAGTAIGLFAAALLTRLVAHLLFETSAADPATYIAIACVLISAATAACVLPARRASRVDPMIALRHE